MHRVAAAERAALSSLVPCNFEGVEESHLRWMDLKDTKITGHDMFLIGPPGSYRRKVAMKYCELAKREVEHLVITRDTTESDLKQRKEIVAGGRTVYVDSAPVRAALNGRILLLDGIEKAERNVLPTLNNLLENREVQLDDGRFLTSHKRFDELAKDLGVEECKRRGLMRVSEQFRVVALGLPVPPFAGAPLDPPLRSRFQARFIQTPITDSLAAYPRFAAAVTTVNAPASSGAPRLPHISYDAVQRVLRLQRLPSQARPSLADSVYRSYPYHQFSTDTAVRDAAAGVMSHFGLNVLPTAEDEAPPVAVQLKGDHAAVSIGTDVLRIASPCTSSGAGDPKYMETPGLKDLFKKVVQDFAVGHDVCLVGPAGNGKSHFIRNLAKRLGYGDESVEYVFLYGDMGSRDLLQRRATDATGLTTWEAGSVVKAAQNGSLLVLDGVQRLPNGLISALAPLIADRQLQIRSTKGTGEEVLLRDDRSQLRGGAVKIHPRFRIIATATPPTAKEQWMSEEILAMFSYIETPSWGIDSLRHVLGQLHPKRPELLTEVLPPLMTLFTGGADRAGDLPAFSLRQLLRAATAAAHAPQRADMKPRAVATVVRQLLVSSLPPVQRKQVLAAINKSFYGDGPVPVRSAALDSRHPQVTRVSASCVKIGDVECSPLFPPKRPERVPHVSFVEIPRHMQAMEEMARELFENEQQFLMVLGPQGVGKNRITDYLMQKLQWERMYMQLHRDTTVQQLTATPQLEGGVLTWKDSPLLIAAREGLCLMLDEADKAPLEVVILLKSLVEDGYLMLSDGRKISRNCKPNEQGVIPIHPDFRMIVLANPPGFPFMGNDLFRECGDVFSVFSLDNADELSELHLLTSEAPSVDPVILTRLVKAFGDLRQLNQAGKIGYPYSTRELLHIARHMHAIPDSTLEDALNNVLSFDRLDPVSHQLLPVFERHGIPVASVLQGTVEAMQHATRSERALDVMKNVTIAPIQRLKPAKKLGTVALSPATPIEPVPSVQGCGGGTVTGDTPSFHPLGDVKYTRASGFSEELLSFVLPVEATRRGHTECRVSDATFASIAGRKVMHILSERPAVLWTCPDPVGESSVNECCAVRWGGYGGGATGTEELTVNGKVVTAGDGQLAAVATGVVAYMPGDTAQLLSVAYEQEGYLRESSQSPVITLMRLSHLLFRGKKPIARYFLCPVVMTAEPAPASDLLFLPEHCCVMVSPSEKRVILIDARVRVFREVCVDADFTSVSAYSAHGCVEVSCGLNTLISFSPSAAGKPTPIMVRTAAFEGELLGVQATSTRMGHIVGEATSAAPLYASLVRDAGVFGWSREATLPAAQQNVVLVEPKIGTVVRSVGPDETKGIEVVNTAHPATAKVLQDKPSVDVSAIISSNDAVEGAVTCVVRSDGSVSCYQTEEKRLVTALSTYLKIRGLARYVDEALNPSKSHANSRQRVGPGGTQEKLSKSGGKGGGSGGDGEHGSSGPRNSKRDPRKNEATPQEKLHAGHFTAAELAQRIAEAASGHRRQEEMAKKSKDASGKPKHGEEDGQAHSGGNRYAGGSGGADTAGMGGKGGPYRLDNGHDVKQISDEAKKNISKEAAEAARKMGREALKKRLESIDMGETEHSAYTEMREAVQSEIDALRGVLKRVEAASKERVWLRGMEGELDDSRIVDARAGETAVFRRRADKRPQPGVQTKPKRLALLFDVSASMYRFNGLDGRLRSSAECAVLLMEALDGFQKTFEWTLMGHSGDGPDHVFVKFGEPPKTDLERLKVVERMWAYAQHCQSGDYTLEGVQAAVAHLQKRDTQSGPADEKIVLAFSDANLDRYSISATGLEKALVTDKRTHASIFFLASSDGEAERITRQVTPGHAYTALNMQMLPTMIKSVFSHSLSRAAGNSHM